MTSYRTSFGAYLAIASSTFKQNQILKEISCYTDDLLLFFDKILKIS
jgi:hypothetical protein